MSIAYLWVRRATAALALVSIGQVRAGAAAQAPGVYCVPAQNLAVARQQLAAGDLTLAGALTALRAKADAALGAAPGSVMDKAGTAPSGDKHDYFSLAPYWWPDPAAPQGAPYIKRDGYVNPDSRAGTDSVAFAKLCGNVEVLSLAYAFTNNEAYAEKAAGLVRTWFLDPATAMNPRVNYGQVVPGTSVGRFEGLIEMRNLTRITDGLALIDGSPAWRPQDRAAFKTWLSAYYDWLQHNDLKAEDTSTENNHLTWRDVQIVQFGLVLGRDADARAFLHQEFDHLLAVQIKRDGQQPRELVRTNSLGYSLFNLEALVRLATLGEYLGVDCWSVQVGRSGTLLSVLDALAPYVDPAKPWPVKEVTPAARSRLLPLLGAGYQHTQSAKYRDLLLQCDANGDTTWCLWWAPAVATGS